MYCLCKLQTEAGKTYKSYLVHKARAQVNLQDNVVYISPHRKAFCPILRFNTKK